MGNPTLNCAGLICCTPGSKNAIVATAQALKDQGCDPDVADKAAPYIQQAFDLAKKGTLQPFKDWVAEEARGEAYTGD